MQPAGLVDLRTFFLYLKVFCEGFQKLFLCQSVQILHHTVVVDDLELAVREGHCHEVIVFLFAVVVRVLSLLLCADKGCSSRTVVTVSYIEGRDSFKYLGDAVDVLLTVDDPEMMAESVLCDKVIFGLLSNISAYDAVYFLVVRI